MFLQQKSSVSALKYILHSLYCKIWPSLLAYPMFSPSPCQQISLSANYFLYSTYCKLWCLWSLFISLISLPKAVYFFFDHLDTECLVYNLTPNSYWKLSFKWMNKNFNSKVFQSPFSCPYLYKKAKENIWMI